MVGLIRREDWRPVRCLAVAFVVVLLLTFVSGAQPHYPTGLVVVLLAAGAVPAGELVSRSRPWRVLLVAGVGINTVVSLLIGLPILPPDVLGDTPIPDMSLVAADQVGWREYVDQVVAVAEEHDIDEVVTSNYGEAGALARYAEDLHVFSGQNALFDAGPPKGETVVFVGGQLPIAEQLFARCTVEARLDNGVGVDNEEQGVPVAVCSELIDPWSEAWPRLRHLD